MRIAITHIIAIIAAVFLLVPQLAFAIPTSPNYQLFGGQVVPIAGSASDGTRNLNAVGAPISGSGTSGSYIGNVGGLGAFVITTTTPSSGGGGGGGGSSRFTECQDPEALNFQDTTGFKHDEDKCVYSTGEELTPEEIIELVTTLNQDNTNGIVDPVTGLFIPFSGQLCPSHLIISQNLARGARDGLFHRYQGGVIREVKILQAHMNRLGHRSGPEDGIFGPLTEGGVKSLQSALGVAADGIVGPITRAAINNSCNQAPPTVDVCAFPYTAKPGDSGYAVTRIQEKLTELGYLKSQPNGFFGASTAAATKAFQKDYSIWQGDPALKGPTTWFYRLTAAKAEQLCRQEGIFVPVVPEVTEPIVVPVPSTAPVQLPAPIAPVAPAPEPVQQYYGPLRLGGSCDFPYTAKPGDSGYAVASIQQKLTDLGFYSGRISGVYDSATGEATRAFQAAYPSTWQGGEVALTGPTDWFYGRSGAMVEELCKGEGAN